jgi:hypothetical protein
MHQQRGGLINGNRHSNVSQNSGGGFNIEHYSEDSQRMMRGISEEMQPGNVNNRSSVLSYGKGSKEEGRGRQ